MIDPRILSELLKQSFLQKLDLSSAGAPKSTNEQPEFDFAKILENVMGQSSESQSPKTMDTSESLLASMPYAPIPYSLSKQTSFDSTIAQASSKYGVDSGLIKAVIETESFFDTNAVSRSGAKGLMQLMDDTGKSLGVENPYDPQQNIDGGTKFLSYLINKYEGNIEVALAAYNAGPGRVDRLGISTNNELRAHYKDLPMETQNYVDKVLGTWTQYKLQS